jgi:hypothetical protein
VNPDLTECQGPLCCIVPQVKHAPFVVIASLLLACNSTSSGDTAPVQLGVVRTVDEARLENPVNWGDELDLALETEFWDLIGNSDHARYPAWHSKAKAYFAANLGADPRLGMLISAGAVFSLTTLFQNDDPLAHLAEYSDYIADATVGIRDAIEPLGDHEPALVFFHNNQAMLAFLLSENADLGICHLEKLRNIEDIGPTFPARPIAATVTSAGSRAGTVKTSMTRTLAPEFGPPSPGRLSSNRSFR